MYMTELLTVTQDDVHQGATTYGRDATTGQLHPGGDDENCVRRYEGRACGI